MNPRISRLIKFVPALGAVALLPLLAACNERAASAPVMLERPVQVQRVGFANENSAREFVGVVRARHDIIGDQEALIFAELVAKAPHQLARPTQRKRDGKPQHAPAGPHENRMRTHNRKVK